MTNKIDFVLAASESESPILQVTTAKATEFSQLPSVPEAERWPYHLVTTSALRLINSGVQVFATKGTYRVIADPKLGQAVLEGVKGAPGLYRGFTRSGGKITQHAKFKPVGGAKLATLGLAVFEAATIVTSTVHLQEIGKQLKQVNETLDQLQDLLDDQRLGHLQGNLAYLVEILALLELSALSATDSARYGDQLETIYRECLAELQTAEKQLLRRQRELVKTEKVRLKGALFWKRVNKEGQEKLKERVVDFSSSLEIALLAQETAVMTCAVGTQLGRSPVQMEFRLRELERLVERLKVNWNDYADILKTKLEDVAGRDEMRKTIAELAKLVQRHHQRPKRLLGAVSTLQQQLRYKESLEFLIKVEDGQVVDVRRVVKELA